MDVAFEKRSWMIEHALAEVSDVRRHSPWSHPDWLVLRARMRAAREAWQVLRETQGAARRCGSFDRGSAWQLSALKTDSMGVNQKASGNGKRGQHKHGVAGITSTGVRG